MLLSQKLANFTKGQADTLRKAMGKKNIKLLAELKPMFLENGVSNGHDATVLEKVWKDWEAFASYAFNKSHSTCYAWVAYQTAYLKANYPAEYMASVLSNNMNDIKQVTLFMEECRRMGLAVLGPDVNESAYKFRVNNAGAIRFGLGAMKGVGGAAVNSIVENRAEGPYLSLFDMSRRISLKDCNKRVFESLALGGGFDGFPGLHRAQYFAIDDKGRSTLENALRYGNAWQEGENSSQVSLFGEADTSDIPEPNIPEAEEWNILDKLNKEKEVVGIYISGHPLDDFRVDMDTFCTKEGLKVLQDLERLKGRQLSFGGMVTASEERIAKNGNRYGNFTVEDYEHSERFFVFGEDYVKFREYMVPGFFIFMKGVVRERKRGELIELEFKINTISLLEELRAKMTGELKVSLNLEHLTDALIDDFVELINRFPGSVPLTMSLYDTETKIDMPARNARVTVDSDLLNALTAIEGMEFEIVSR